MKFHFNERQRFSLRKYSFGLASVLLGTAFFLSGQVASADEAKVSETVPSSVLSAKPDSSNSTSESSAPETADSKPTVADKSVVTPETTEVSSNSEKVATESPKSEKSEVSAKESSEETAKATEVKAEVAEKDDKSTDKAPAEVSEKDDKSTDKAPAPAEARRSTRTRRATSENKREVSNWSEFVSALEDGNVSEITVNGDVVAQGDNGNTDNGRSGSVDRRTTINAPSRAVTIQGKNENARLELLSHTLELTGASWELNLKNLKIATANSKGPIDLSRTSGSNTVTFENVTSVGSSLYGGGGNTHVVIKGNTTSTVSDSYQAANGQTQHVQRNVGAAGRSDKRRESNIHDAKSVTVAEGASLTLNRSSQGDAITLESGAKFSVKDKASLTINMNTGNQTDSARYHNAGIFMADSGTVETGKGSKLVLNTSIGQGISIGINRPGDGVTDRDRFGGYGVLNNGRKNGPSRVLIGEEGTFEFNGRDGIMMGNNSELVTGQNSKVRFENRGRGVALDFGNDSRVAFGKHSTNTFHSDGKGPRSGGGPSGSYDGYNYIGLNENGKILVDDFATFRVQMDNRGDNAWDDVISLGSQNGTKSEPLFQANKGSIVDIRDDNTNYYAELISVALGSSRNTIFQFNNPLYVSFMRYTNSQGLSAGEITGKLPLSIPQGNNPQDIGHGNILYISEKSQASRNRIEFNGPASRNGGSTVGTYTVYSMNKDGRDSQTKDKQSSVWTNIQGGSMPIAGFQSGRPDIQPANAASVRTGSSSGGVSATDRTYGIDPVGHNRQNIWVSNGSKINPTGVHKNVIKYVYEDGTPVKLDKDGNPVKDVIQSSDWNRTLDVSIDKEGFENILRNSSVRNGDEFLAAYSKAKYHISDIDGDNIADTGWKEDGTNSGTHNYGTIASPKLKGYKPEILSTNVPGLEVGAKADSVSVSYDSSKAPDTLIEAQAGKRTVSETYWRNIVAKSDLGTYETVVVYKRPMQSAIIKYIDTSANNKELAKDQVSGKSDEAINYSTDAKIADFVNKGYKLVDDGFKKASEDQKKFDDDENIEQEFVVRLEHDVTPVGPNNPHKPTDPINPKDPKSPKYPETDQWKKDVTSTVHYVVSDGNATAPANNVQNAQWTRTLNVDKVTGKVLNPNEPWTANKANYDAVPTPGLTGYYADKGSVASKTVTQENLEETVTYKPLGNLVPKPETPNDPNFPSKPGVKYPNNPTDPTKPGQPLVPDVPGYEPHLPDPKDPTKPGKSVPPGTPITPEKPGEDTPIIYVPKTTKVTKPTKQTVTFEGAGTATPADKVQDNFTFTGKQKNGTTTWDQPNHTYGKETVPVVEHYYADKKEAGSKTVTPDQPEVTDKVTYKPLGKIIPVDPEGNPIPKAPTPQYNNDPQDPTKGGKTPTPDIPGYVTDIPSVTPDKPGEDTKVVYRKAEQKAIIKYVDQNTGKTLENDQVSGKSGEAIDYSTAAKIKYYEDRGYVLVSDEFPAGATYDTDASRDQTWTVTLKHGETPVGPNNPLKPTDPINPNDPNSPKYPAEDQWKKDVTSTVHYVVSDGNATAPADNVQNAQWTRTLTLDKVTGEVLSSTPWASNKTNYDAVPTPGLTGYYADKGSVASKTVTQENLEETVTYKPLGNLVPKPETPNDPNFPSKPGVKYPNNPTDPTKPGQPLVPDVPGYEPHLPDPKDPTKPGKSVPPGTPITPEKPGEDTPIIYVPKTTKVTKPTKQTVTFEGAGTATPADKVQDNFTFTGKQKNGTTTWDQPNHTYGKETVPVVEHYYADKKEAGSKTVTPDQPEVTDKVTYKPLGKIIPVDPEGNPIPKAPTPQYNNDPQDPTKGGKTPTPDIPGYVTDIPSVTPDKPGEDTKVVYRKAEQKAIIKYVDQNTGKTLENDQVSGKSGEAIDYSTAAKIKYYEDRGYVLLSDEFPAGATYDTDASRDQTWTVTLKHGETPVGPNNPLKPTDPINPNDPNSPKYPAEDQWKKDVTSTVHYVVSDGNATAPADNVQNAQWTRTLTLDKVTGEVLSSTPWASNKTNYDAVPTPGLTGYYADKGSVASKTVTQENLEETVTYRPLGNLVPKPEKPNDPNFPSTPEVKYPNDPNDPTKPGKPVVPNVPGYKPYLPVPNDPTKPDKDQPVEPGKELPNLPTNPGEDTPIIYVPIVNDVKKPTKQTVTFEGAGTATPADKVQDNFTFTGKQKNGTTTWDQPNHTYGKETVPVVEHYYADKKEAGSKTVTPDQPEVTDKVTYKPLGKIIPVDPEGNKIPSAPTPQYNNDPQDPTKGGKTPTPVIPGYVTDTPSVTPNDPGSDTPVVYRKAEQKAIIKYVDQNTGETLENDQVGGKSGEAIDYSTAAKIKYYEDRGYVLVSDEFPAGATYDTDASRDQIWTVTLKHGETPVGPNNPHKPTDPINPNDPNSPKYPAEDQWKKDVTSTVHYVVSDGKATAPADNVQNAQWTRTLKLDKVTGKVLNPDAPWTANKTNYDAVPTPGLTGYYADKAGVASKTVTQENLEETVTYKPLGNLVPKPEKPNDPNFPSTPEVKYPNDPNDPTKPGQPLVPDVPGYEPHLPDPKDPTKPGKPVEPGKPITPDKPGEDTPIIYVPKTTEVTKPTKQTVTFEGAGTATPADKVQDNFTFTGKQKNGTTTWDQPNHTYGKETVPVVKGYYADKKEAGSKTVTPDQPEVTDKVTYKALGKIIQVDEAGNVIPGSVSKIYENNPSNPTEAAETKIPDAPTGYKIKEEQPQAWGYNIVDKTIEPNDESDPDRISRDTPIIYVPIVNDVKKPTKQTVKFEGAGDKTPGDNVQDDFTFTGKENKASGTTTWNEKSHTYGKVSVPVIPGYYADKTEAGGKTVTPENPEATDTVTYKPLGNLVPKPGTPDDPNFPSTPKVKYPNDPTDPGKPGQPVVPNVPGYKPYLPDPKDPSKPGKPVEPGKPITPENPGEDTPIIYVPIVNDVKKPTKQTVKFEGAGDKTPGDNVQDDFTFTGKENKASGTTTWNEKSHTYGKVSVPVIPGYYADKTEAGGKTVTPENPEATDTVTYKPLGNLVPKPGTPDDPNFPSTPKVKYPNDPTDPGKPGQPVVPNVPGYKPYLPDPKDPSKPGKPVEPGKPITPENPGEDTPIIYVPIVNDVKKPTKQTVKFEGAGDKTPGDNVQDDFTFTGKENKASGTTTWNEKSHTYGKVSVPVIPGYYADKTEAGGKTVTPENPEATDTVTYKPLGNLVPKPGTPDDPNFPSTPKVKYPNDPTDPGKPGKPVVPNVPGYKPYLPDPKDPSKPGKPVEPGKPITPENPGEDTPIIYVPIVNDVKKPTKQTVKFEGAGDKTPGDNVQDDFTFTGKENKASGTTTWNEKSHTYGKVSVPVIPGYYADKTEAGGKTVTPENPEATDTVTYKPLGSLVPKPGTPDDPNFPSTPKVKYPNDPTDPGKPGQPVVPNVPGYKPYLPDPKDPSKPGKPVEPGKPITPENPGEDTPIIYVPIVNDVKKPTKQTVKFEGAGDKTPGDNVQDDFTFTGKENKASGTTTWNEKSHTYGKVSVPVIPGYYADKTEAGGKTVTPENPEATDTVTYKPLGNLVPKPGTPDDPNFPSTPKVKYPNDPTDPGKPGQPVVPNVPGYKPYLPDPKDPSKPGKPVEPGKPITPENPGEDTPIIYVPIVNDVKKPTKQTVKFEGAGDKTPGDNVQDDFTFTGKENKASGTTTWNEKSHTYGKVSVPVIPGYYADKTEAGGKTVTPENSEATDTVTYKPLGNLVPKPGTPDDPNFPSTPKVKYPNDPTDPGKPGQPVVPNVPGYKPYLPDPKDPSKPGKPVEPGKPITPENPGEDTPIIYVPIVNDVKKPTKQTVKFEGAGDKTPGDNVQDDFTFTGKENKASGTTTWNEKSHTYGKVSVPVIPGYYADKTEAGGKTVTPENPEATDTVTYKPLGNLVPKPGTPDDPNFPSTPKVKYPNDPTDPGKPGQPVVPNVPGYKPYLPDPKDPSKPGKPVEPGKPITPENPGEDTPIIYVPIVNDVKKPTKQTVKFEGAGDKTPGDNVQDDFTFTGKENKASGTTTWNEKSHTYGKVSVPVIPGYYADKTEAGGKTVTPENPEATDTVTYKPLGNLVPKPGTPDDPNFPSTPKVKYPNDPTDPGKPGQPVVPNVPGYKPYLPDPKDPSKPGKPVEPGKPITPENPGEDTPIIYVPIVNDVKKPTKQTVKFEGAGDKTPGDNVQDDFTFTGKENKASGTTTWNEKSHTYGKVSVPVIPGYYADKTEAGGKTVTPENPEATDTVTYKPLGNLVPKPGTPDDPNFPSTPKVKYPNDPTDPGKPGQPVVPNVPGYKPYLPDPKDPSKPGKPVEPGKPITPENPGEDTPIIYVPIVNDVKKPTKQTVKFEGAGDKTPGDNVQDDFTFTGKENKASGTTTWNEKSHTYGKVSVPVIPGYYADKTEAGGKTVTPENPEATDTVTYKPLGSLVPKPGTPDDPNFPSTPKVKYPNDPTDPGKPGKPVVPNVPGYKPYLPDPKDPSKPGKPVEPGKPITPENPGEDTPIIYVPVKPDTPVVPNPESQTPAKPDPKPLDPEKVVQELPNTGTDSNAIMTGLGIIGMATTLLGLAQKKKED